MSFSSSFSTMSPSRMNDSPAEASPTYKLNSCVIIGFDLFHPDLQFPCLLILRTASTLIYLYSQIFFYYYLIVILTDCYHKAWQQHALYCMEILPPWFFVELRTPKLILLWNLWIYKVFQLEPLHTLEEICGASFWSWWPVTCRCLLLRLPR